MTISARIEKHFWVCFLLAIFLGLLAPEYVTVFENYLMYMLMLVLFVVFLKVDLRELRGHARRPLLLAYILLLNLIVIPILFYFLSLPFSKDTALALVLLAALPTGMGAAALAGLVKGKASLALILSVSSSLIAPLTLPAVFYLLFREKIELDYFKLFLRLGMLILIPLAASQAVKLLLAKAVKKAEPYLGVATIAFVSLVIMTVIGQKADHILGNKAEVLYLLLISFGAFLVLQLAGYFMVYWLSREERIAVSVSKMIMNNALGVVIALEFFNRDYPRVALILILSEIPWSTMTVLYRFYGRKHPATTPRSD